MLDALIRREVGAWVGGPRGGRDKGTNQATKQYVGGAAGHANAGT